MENNQHIQDEHKWEIVINHQLHKHQLSLFLLCATVILHMSGLFPFLSHLIKYVYWLTN